MTVWGARTLGVKMTESVALLDRLYELGHSSFRLAGVPTLYFDPYQLSGRLPLADIVLITHDHSDQCLPDDVAHVSGPNTVIANRGGAKNVWSTIRTARAGDIVHVGDATIEAVPADNPAETCSSPMG